MLSKLLRLLPASTRAKLQHKARRWVGTSTGYTVIGAKGPLAVGVFEKIRDIPGWFTLDDCAHFQLVMEMQSMNGVTGDMFEIGSYHGRSTAMMAAGLKPGEKIHVCDAFDSDTEDHYGNKPTQETVISNIRKVTPGIEDTQIVTYKCLSNDIQLPADQKFRLVHIDGGHSAEQVYFDLELCARHLCDKGVIVIDDYANRMWPTVSVGVDKYLEDNPVFNVLADMNRHGAQGRKLYIYRS